MANWTEIFMGAQETNAYRLVMRNLEFNALKNNIFGGKMGVADTQALTPPPLKGLSPHQLAIKLTL